jgi:death-on-curing protein
MKKIQFLRLEDVLFLHKIQIEKFGGSHGVRSMPLLQSALGMPEATFSGIYLHATLHEMAAAYFYHLVMNHPFVDGNKRIGALSADVFLDINGLNLAVDEADFEQLTLDTAQGKMDKSQIAVFFKKHSKRVKT